jgi:hypothetical protein
MATIQLNSDEALVLVEFLLRFQDSEVLTIEHKAEERVLWDVGAMLEKQVPELLAADYKVRLSRAREALVAE